MQHLRILQDGPDLSQLLDPDGLSILQLPQLFYKCGDQFGQYDNSRVFVQVGTNRWLYVFNTAGIDHPTDETR